MDMTLKVRFVMSKKESLNEKTLSGCVDSYTQPDARATEGKVAISSLATSFAPGRGCKIGG